MVEAEFLVSFSYPNKRELKLFGTQWKSCFSCTSIEPVHFQSHTMTRSRMVPPTLLGLQNQTILPVVCSGLPRPLKGHCSQLLKINSRTLTMAIDQASGATSYRAEVGTTCRVRLACLHLATMGNQVDNSSSVKLHTHQGEAEAVYTVAITDVNKFVYVCCMRCIWQ